MDAFAEALVAACAEPPALPLTLDMAELELEDGVSVARMITALRALAARHGPLQLRAAPQMLAHTLYKAGILNTGAVALEAPRQEEATTAN
ncbi:MAG: hypothetical protein H6739_03645 [Alphaproteobacteria bacterium]|nr:hypothetical protein [Alphaproteobacteria bacterium]